MIPGFGEVIRAVGSFGFRFWVALAIMILLALVAVLRRLATFLAGRREEAAA